MSIIHLPAAAQAIVVDQGWNDESIIIHLIGYVQENVPAWEKGLETYFSAVADEENGYDPDTGDKVDR